MAVMQEAQIQSSTDTPHKMFVQLLLLLVLLALISVRRPKNFPPGPRGLPLVGYLPFLNKLDPDYPFRGMAKLANVYGPVTGFYMGPRLSFTSIFPI